MPRWSGRVAAKPQYAFGGSIQTAAAAAGSSPASARNAFHPAIDGDVVVVVVEERPVVASVEFVGTKEFEKDALTKALREVGIAEGRPFDRALVDRAEQELKRQYLAKSLYGAEVITTITPLERNRVNARAAVPCPTAFDSRCRQRGMRYSLESAAGSGHAVPSHHHQSIKELT